MEVKDQTIVEAVRQMTNKQMVEAIVDLAARVTALELRATATKAVDGKEMTDADAERVCYGDLSELKHKDAAERLGLTYGQVYSARGEFTFKAVHKTAKDAGKKNRWAK